MGPTLAEDPRALPNILRNWQTLETASIENTTRIIEKSQNPLIKIVMEIIRRDSETHYKVQQALLDSLEVKAFSLTPEELAAVWDSIETHAELEQKTIDMATEALRNCRLLAQRQLLTYLIDDEKKHDRLLSQLEAFKHSLHPYA